MAAASGVPALPPSLKSLQSYMKVASDHDVRNPVVSYYARMYVAQEGIKIDGKSPEARAFLIGLMDSLSATKKSLSSTNEAFKDDIVASAVIEEYGLKLFTHADAQDRAENFNKSVVKAFYVSSLIMDTLAQFGEVSEEIAHKKKYAKWKAAHITACLRNGEKPHPGPVGWEDEEGAAFGGSVNDAQPPPVGFNPPPSSYGGSQPHQPYPPPSQPPNADPWPNPNYQAPTATFPPPASTAAPPDVAASASASTSGLPALAPEQYLRAQKLMKFASSALDYQDTPTAIDNLEKAMRLLRTGRE